MLMEALLAALAAHVRRERALKYARHLVLGFAIGSIGQGLRQLRGGARFVPRLGQLVAAPD